MFAEFCLRLSGQMLRYHPSEDKYVGLTTTTSLSLNWELGSADNHELLNGIMFAASASKITTPILHNLIQADAAHMNFGNPLLGVWEYS